MARENLIRFRWLFLIARFSSLAMLTLIPVQIAIYVLFPPPDTVVGIFDLFAKTPLLGLLSLDLLYLVNNLILAVLYLALWVSLFKENPSVASLALMFGVLGVACYIPSNPSLEMLHLSSRYFLALPSQRSIYLAAGEALMAGYTGTAFNVYYVLSTVSLLLFSYAIFKSHLYDRSIALWGFASGFFMIIPSSAGSIGMVFSLLSLIPWVVFVALLMVHFKKLAASSLWEGETAK
jgi:hypothetical protein